MSTAVVMPQMGESIAEGTVVRWIKKVGDTVDRDEPLFEISTDKVDAEIPAPAAGVLLSIAVGVGETVPVGSVVGTIGAAGEQVDATPAQASPPPEPAPAAPPRAAETPMAPPKSAPAPGRPAPAHTKRERNGNGHSTAASPAEAREGRRSSPLV